MIAVGAVANLTDLEAAALLFVIVVVAVKVIWPVLRGWKNRKLAAMSAEAKVQGYIRVDHPLTDEQVREFRRKWDERGAA